MPLEFSRPTLKETQQAAQTHRCPWCGVWTAAAKGIFCPPCWRGMPAEGQDTVRFNVRIGSPVSARRFGMIALHDAFEAGTFRRAKYVRVEHDESEVAA